MALPHRDSRPITLSSVGWGRRLRVVLVMFVLSAVFPCLPGFAGDGVFVRGDANMDGIVDLSDAAAIIGYLSGLFDPGCSDACDANDDGLIDLADPITISDWLFDFGPAPDAPFPFEGADPTADELGCGPALPAPPSGSGESDQA